jgi:hypothetical protein
MNERSAHGLAAFEAAAPDPRPLGPGPCPPARAVLPAEEARRDPPWLAGLRAAATEETRDGAAGGGGGPRRIAVMIGQLGQGGSERQLYFFLAHCDRTRWAPTLYVSGELGPWEEPIRALGVPVVLLTGSPLAKLRRFRAACRAERPACFFSWSSYTNGFGLALLGTGVRRIGSFRNAGFADLPEPGRRAWMTASLAGSPSGCATRARPARACRRPGSPGGRRSTWRTGWSCRPPRRCGLRGSCGAPGWSSPATTCWSWGSAGSWRRRASPAFSTPSRRSARWRPSGPPSWGGTSGPWRTCAPGRRGWGWRTRSGFWGRSRTPAR